MKILDDKFISLLFKATIAMGIYLAAVIVISGLFLF